MKRILTATTLLAIFAMGPAANAEIIYFDDFTTGTNGALDGQAPQVRPGTETWLAASVFSKNTAGGGVVNSSGSGAAYVTMPTFNLNDVYQLTARVSNTSTGTGWVGVGWTTQDTSATAWNAAGTGRHWMLWRGNDEIRSFTSGAGGTAGPTGTNAAGESNVLDMRIVIDGTSGTNVNVEYFYKNPSASTWTSYFDQNVTDTSLNNIKSVGFTTNTSGTSVLSYELVAIPEPGSLALLGLGGLLVASRRRRDA